MSKQPNLTHKQAYTALYILGGATFLASGPIAFWHEWYFLFAIVGALMVIAGGFIHAQEIDAHYERTIYGQKLDKQMANIRRDDHRGVWPMSNGAPE